MPVGTYSNVRDLACIFCKGANRSSECKDFNTIKSRKDRLKKLRRCTRCTRLHDSRECNTEIEVCRICKKGKHHTFLCIRSKFERTTNTSADTTTAANKSSAGPSQATSTSKKRPWKGEKGDEPSPKRSMTPTTSTMSIVSDRDTIHDSVALATATVYVGSAKG